VTRARNGRTQDCRENHAKALGGRRAVGRPVGEGPASKHSLPHQTDSPPRILDGRGAGRSPGRPPGIYAAEGGSGWRHRRRRRVQHPVWGLRQSDPEPWCSFRFNPARHEHRRR